MGETESVKAFSMAASATGSTKKPSAENASLNHLDAFFKATARSKLAPHHAHLKQALASLNRHGDEGKWEDALQAVVDAKVLRKKPLSEKPLRKKPLSEKPLHKKPLDKKPLHKMKTDSWDLTADTLRIGNETSPLLPDEAIMAFHPWRKGPFLFRGTFIDTEWRSDWKWQRIRPHISDLQGRLTLDLGCGNGYHLLRMLGDGASLALGVDPTWLFNYQFRLIQSQLPPNNAWLLPLRTEHLPAFNCFDSVFSLGVLYHRRSPLDHLAELLSFLKPGGELILETLVVEAETEGDAQAALLPTGRYAMMGNVYFIPSTGLLEAMLAKAGFTRVRTVDVSRTSTEEQRATKWMTFLSLSDYLDPQDPSRTVEGHPAPTRAIVIAEKPPK